MKEQRFKKVDDDVWDDIVARMKERERKRMEYDKKDTTVTVNRVNNTITIEGNYVIIDASKEDDFGHRVEGKRIFQRMVPGYSL